MSMDFGTTKTSIIQYYHDNYPWEYYKRYPEFCVKKLKLGDNALNRVLQDSDFDKKMSIIHKEYDIRREADDLDKKLPPIGERTREQVTEWLTNSSLTYDDIIGVGW